MNDQVKPKTIYKTTITVTVLSDSPYDLIDLETLDHDITEGDCSGDFKTTNVEELTGKDAVEAIESQNSDPEFFGIDEEGNEQ
jgi:hypothetical protein